MQRRKIQLLTSTTNNKGGRTSTSHVGIPTNQVAMDDSSSWQDPPSMVVERYSATYPTVFSGGNATLPGIEYIDHDIHQNSHQDITTVAHSESENPGSPDEDEDLGILPRVGYDSDTSDDGEEVRDARLRTRIRPTGNTFKKSKQVLAKAYSIMRRHYNGPWTSWSKVPDDQQLFWWDEFKNRFFWKDKHAEKVEKNWRAKCSQYLRSKFADARRHEYIPDFVDLQDWDVMSNHWKNDPSFKRQSEVGKCSRASEPRDGIASYTGGSKSVEQHLADYELKHGKRMSQEKLMEKTYKKKNGEWSGPRAQTALERYKILCENFRESHPEGLTQEDVEKLWSEAVGGQKRGRVFGQGSLYSRVLNSRNPADGPCDSSRVGNLNTSQVEELKKTMEAELRKKIEEEVRKSTEDRMQQLLIQQRQEDELYFQRLLDVRLSRYAHSSPQAGTSFTSLMTSTTHLYGTPSLPVGSIGPSSAPINTPCVTQPSSFGGAATTNSLLRTTIERGGQPTTGYTNGTTM